MKKTISIIILSVLMMCTILPVVAFADGQILWNEDFSSKAENDWIWDEDTTKFFISNGKLEGWAEAVVQQSNFLVDRGAPRRYKECAWKIECAALEDGGNDAESHGMSLWFADYISPSGDMENVDGTITYMWGYDFEKQTLNLSLGFDNDGENYKPAGFADDKPYFSVYVPDGPVISSAGDSTFTLGMRLSGGKASFYMNDVKYTEIDTMRGAASFTQVGSPILVFNTQLHCTFDNLVVATPDYDLFNEAGNGGQQGGQQGGGQQGGQQGGAQQGGGTEKVIVKKSVVVGTDAQGNAITEIVTEEVVRQVAATGGNATGGNAAKTGDTAIIVIAVMITALGSALVVWKVRSR